MQTVMGMFDSRAEAEAAIERLQEIGIDRDRISVAMKDSREKHALTTSTGAHDLSAEGATTGMVSGAGVGALVGLAIAGSTVVLPGIGPFVIAGPLAAALTGAGIGAASGGLIGGLIGAGIPEDEAQHFSSGMERGNVLVAAHVPDDEVNATRKIFDEEGSLRSYNP
jgi:uncharacterized membrane protein